jgi:NADH pyrophosphatase NudC (nudix superfamily)
LRPGGTSTEDRTGDGEELLEARWFTRPELAQYAADKPLGRPDSIDRHLLRTWLDGSDKLEPDETGRRKT